MTSWGNTVRERRSHEWVLDWRFAGLPACTAPESMLPVGMRRSYGDQCINAGGATLSTRRLDRLVHFDRDAGYLVCEAGVTLGELLRVTVPAGWYLPVVPGTQHVSVGGAIANDIHGKNHASAGSFGCHVRELELLRSDVGRVECTAATNPALFRATIGGLGLTGLITRAGIALKRIGGNLLLAQDLPFSSLQAYRQLIAESEGWEYSVAWLDGSSLARDCRGIFSRARHSERSLAQGGDRRRYGIPDVLPFSLVNNASAWCFCRAYHALKASRSAAHEVPHEPFFFPLDALDNWNRLYGPGGFYQYQCVIPGEIADRGVTQLLRAVHASRMVSPLIVLKDFGTRRSPGILSFPRHGLTLAMDFPAAGERLEALFARLDAVVRDHGGAIYPAKDARMGWDMFAASFPDYGDFLPHIDPAFSSSFWRRLQCTRKPG